MPRTPQFLSLRVRWVHARGVQTQNPRRKAAGRDVMRAWPWSCLRRICALRRGFCVATVLVRRQLSVVAVLGQLSAGGLANGGISRRFRFRVRRLESATSRYAPRPPPFSCDCCVVWIAEHQFRLRCQLCLSVAKCVTCIKNMLLPEPVSLLRFIF